MEPDPVIDEIIGLIRDLRDAGNAHDTAKRALGKRLNGGATSTDAEQIKMAYQRIGQIIATRTAWAPYELTTQEVAS